MAAALVAGAAVSVTAAAAARVAAKGAGALAAKLAAGAAVCAVAFGMFLSSRSEAGSQVEPHTTVSAVPGSIAPEQRPPVRVPSKDLPTAEVEPPSPSPTSEVPSFATPTGSPKRTHRTSGAATPSLRAELMLLDQAEGALDDDNEPGRALTVLERHRARSRPPALPRSAKG